MMRRSRECGRDTRSKDSPAQVFGDEAEHWFVFLHRVQNIIDNKYDLVFKGRNLFIHHSVESFMKKIVSGFGNELISNIIFICKIKIKSSFGNTGLLSNVTYGSLFDSVKSTIYWKNSLFIM